MLFVGILVVLGAVVSGFVLSGGDVHLLLQPYEVLVIVGAAIGSVLISTPMPMIKHQKISSKIDRQLNEVRMRNYFLSSLFTIKFAASRVAANRPHPLQYR